MPISERFWWLLSVSSIFWYLTVTGYVAVRGSLDIRHMLRTLAERHEASRED